jgi:putative FmdB family regulatory protein
VPLYDYRCEKGHRYEKREPFGSPAVQPCEKCGETARRVLHAPAIAFKGSGWYKNDSRGSRPSASEEKSSRSGSSDKSAKSAKSDGKSAGATGRKQSGKTEKAAAD